MDVKIIRLEKDSAEILQMAEFAEKCSWAAAPHMARLFREYPFNGWESAFGAFDGGKPVGFCTLMETDFYPENRYYPWISGVFVDEAARGHRISGLLIAAAEAFAKKNGFAKAYIPSDITGLYEKYGYKPIDKLTNYNGDIDAVFCREL